MKLLAILIMFIGIDAYADAQKQVPECATTKEGVREIIMAKWNYSEGKTSYLDGLAGTWGVAGDDSAEGVVIHDNGALAIGSHYITVCPQGPRTFWFKVNGLLAGGNSGFITINSSTSVTISGGKKEVAKVNGTYVKKKGGGNA